MGDDCIECGKGREEIIYWSHFKEVQFCQILTGRFDRQLAIPKKFADNLGDKLTGKIVLRGPSGSIWDVGLMSSGDTLFLKHGWKEFVESHFLEENDILIFKYTGDSRFDVLMFDKISLCEKEASYFVKNCKHMERGYDTRTSMAKSSEDTNESSDDIAEYNRVKSLRSDAARTPTSRRQPSRATANGGRGLCEKETSNSVKKCAPTENGSGSNQKRSLPGSFDDTNESSDDVVEYHQVKAQRSDAARMPTSRRQPTRATTNGRRGTKKYRPGSSSSYPLQLKSHRRVVTEEEIERTRQMAVAAASSLENSFMVVMRATHVYKRFSMAIPSYWTRIHLHVKDRVVELRFKEKTWQTKYHYQDRGSGNSGNGGLTSGWKDFAIDNALEENDVCLFDIVNGTLDVFVLDVKIFRVVEDVIPPSH